MVELVPSLVREVHRAGLPLADFVPAAVVKMLPEQPKNLNIGYAFWSCWYHCVL